MSFIGNSLANSTNLTIATTNQTVNDSVSPTNLVDTFRFTTTAARSSVNLRLTGLGGDANLGLIRDLNGNNLVDANEVLASSLNTGTLAELINLSDLAPATYFVQISLGGVNSASYALGYAVDGGVQQDILWRNPTNGDLGIWAMNGATAASFDRQVTLASAIPTDWQVAGTGDFDGDGNDDVLMRRQSNGEISIRLMRGSEVIQTTPLGVFGASWLVEGVGDFNGDKKADVLWRDTTAPQHKLAFWLMNGTAMTQSTIINIDKTSFKVEGIGDLNADGKSDILFRTTAGQLASWLMDGATIVGGGMMNYFLSAAELWSI